MLLFPLATMFSSGGTNAADPDKALYDAAMAAITDGKYYLVVEADGNKFYLTQDGAFTKEKENAYKYSVSKVSGGTLYDVGILLDPGNGAHYTNTNLNNNYAELHPGTGKYHQDTGNNRNDWERQVFFLNEEGKIAIRSCNTAYGESSWADAGRAFWTYEVDEVGEVVYGDSGTLIPCYSYEPAYIWTLESINSQTPALDANAAVTSVAKQTTPKAKAVRVQAPTDNKMLKGFRSTMKKAPRKVEIADLLSVQWMLCSQYYAANEEGQLEPSIPAAGGTPISFEMSGLSTVSIKGFTPDATEAIEASFSMNVSEEMQAAGVVAEVTIPGGQTLLVNETYGPIILANASSENQDDPIKAYVFQDGYITFDGIWVSVIGGEGEYAGSQWGDYCQSVAMPVNATMTWGEGDNAQEIPVLVNQDPESPKNVLVYNFGGYETAVAVTIKEDKSFIINEQPMLYINSTYGYAYLTGVQGSYLATLTGTGSETALTFDMQWTVYLTDGNQLYLYDGHIYDPATITLNAGEFVYPVIEDVAAVPATPEPSGLWKFDNPSDLMAATVGNVTLSPVVLGHLSVSPATVSEAGITAAEGPGGGSAIFVPALSALKVERAEGATSSTNFSFMIDLKVPDAYVYNGLFQTSTSNSDDSDLFISRGQIGVGAMGYKGSILDDVWYRVVFTNSNGSVKVYLNGEKVIDYETSALRWELAPIFYLLADEDGEKVDTYVSEVAFWETPLTDDEAIALGSAETIPWNTLYINNFSVNAGETVDVPIGLHNTDSIVRIQMKLISEYEGITFSSDVKEYTMCTDRLDYEAACLAAKYNPENVEDLFEFERLNNGIILFGCKYAGYTDNDGFHSVSFVGNDGPLFKIPLTIANTVKSGTYTMEFTQLLVSAVTDPFVSPRDLATSPTYSFVLTVGTKEPVPDSTQTLTLTASGNGAISYGNTSVRSSSQSFDVAELSDVVLTITPDAGHHVETLTINGEDALSRLTDEGKLSLSLPAAIGTWTFDDGTTGSLTATAGVTVADGVATVPVGDYLTTADLGAAANSGTYTIMFDVKVANATNYCCLFNNDLTKDGSLFFYYGKLGLNTGGLGYNGTVEADTWYRVVFVSENAKVSAYLDGALVGQSNYGDEDHWKLGSELYFFADNDGEEQEISVDKLRFWDVALTADEVGMLGACGSVASSYGSLTSSVTVAVTFAANSDLNDDGLVDVADIMTIINNIADDIYLAAADLNNDGFVDVGDIMVVINTIIGTYDNSASVKAMSGLTNTEPVTENNDCITITNEDNIVSIQLDNEFEYSAFQMFVTLPDGVDIDDVIFNSDRLDGFTKFAKKVNERQYIIIGFSMDGNVIAGSAGKILSLSTTGDANDNITISDPIFSIPEAKSYKLRVADSYTTNLQGIQLSQISVRGNTVYVHANSDTTLNIYSVSGALCEQKRLHPGVNTITLPRGQYIINNHKVSISN